MEEWTQDWNQGEELASPTTMTVADLEAFCASIADQREAVDTAKLAHSKEVEKLKGMEKQLSLILKDMNRTSYPSTVGTFTLRRQSRYRVPGTPEDREAFYAYLKERGMFEALITVNYNTLNSFVRSEEAVAIEEGRGLDFKVPGLSAPEVEETIAFKRAVKK